MVELRLNAWLNVTAGVRSGAARRRPARAAPHSRSPGPGLLEHAPLRILALLGRVRDLLSVVGVWLGAAFVLLIHGGIHPLEVKWW